MKEEDEKLVGKKEDDDGTLKDDEFRVVGAGDGMGSPFAQSLREKRKAELEKEKEDKK